MGEALEANVSDKGTGLAELGLPSVPSVPAGRVQVRKDNHPDPLEPHEVLILETDTGTEHRHRHRIVGKASALLSAQGLVDRASQKVRCSLHEQGNGARVHELGTEQGLAPPAVALGSISPLLPIHPPGLKESAGRVHKEPRSLALPSPEAEEAELAHLVQVLHRHVPFSELQELSDLVNRPRVKVLR